MNTTSKKELNAIKKLVIAEDKRNLEKYNGLKIDYFVVELFYYDDKKNISRNWVYSPWEISEAFNRFNQTNLCTIAKERHVVALVSRDILDNDSYRVLEIKSQNIQKDIVL